MLLDAYVRMGDPRAVQIMAAMSGVAVDVGADDMEDAVEDDSKELLDTEEDTDGLKQMSCPVEAQRTATVLFCQGKYERAIKAFRRSLHLLADHQDQSCVGDRGAATLHASIALCELKSLHWRCE